MQKLSDLREGFSVTREGHAAESTNGLLGARDFAALPTKEERARRRARIDGKS